jgi:hypothetical protein
MNLPTIPGLDAAKLAIAPYLLWVKIGAAVVAALLLWWGWHTVTGWREDSHALAGEVKKREAAEVRLAAEVECLTGTACENRAIRFAADGAVAVEKARKAAAEAASKEQARVAAEGQAAVQRAEKAASVAAERLRDAEARLRRSIAEDATCAAQAAEVIKCSY